MRDVEHTLSGGLPVLVLGSIMDLEVAVLDLVDTSLDLERHRPVRAIYEFHAPTTASIVVTKGLVRTNNVKLLAKVQLNLGGEGDLDQGKHRRLRTHEP